MTDLRHRGWCCGDSSCRVANCGGCNCGAFERAEATAERRRGRATPLAWNAVAFVVPYVFCRWVLFHGSGIIAVFAAVALAAIPAGVWLHWLLASGRRRASR